MIMVLQRRELEEDERKPSGKDPRFENLPEEDVYLTMDGSQCRRMVIAYVNKGKVIENGNTVSVGPTMGARLLRITQLNQKTQDEEVVFRRATAAEIDALEQSQNLDDVEHADLSLLGAKARKEALGRGDVNPQTEESEQVKQSIEDHRLPVRRRRRPTEEVE